MEILASVVLSFYHFGGSFHFWALLWGLVLRPFSTCSSLMSFCPFFTFLMASFSSGCYFFSFFSPSVLFSLGQGSFLSSVCDFFVLFFCFLSSTQLFAYWFCSHQFAEHGSIHCLAFSARACSLAFLSSAILFLAICRAVFWYSDLFLFFKLVFRLFSL